MTTEPERVTGNCVFVDRATDDDGWERDEWDVGLVYLDRTMNTKFYTGTAHGTPTVDDVLGWLFMDAQGVEFDGFEDWADNYGMDTDSRKALAMYEGVVAQTERLREFCGDDYDAMQDATLEAING